MTSCFQLGFSAKRVVWACIVCVFVCKTGIKCGYQVGVGVFAQLILSVQQVGEDIIGQLHHWVVCLGVGCVGVRLHKWV